MSISIFTKRAALHLCLAVAILACWLNPLHAATFTVNLADPDANVDASDLDDASGMYDGVCDVDAAAGSQCSLRAAIQEANALPGTDKIEFSVTGTITFADHSYLVTEGLTVVGPGADQLTLDANGYDGVFAINSTPKSSTLAISGLTLTGSEGPFGSGAVSVKGANDSLEMSDVVVTGNSTVANGAGLSFNGLILTVTDSTFTNNTAAKSGGGIYIGINATSATITGTTVDNNMANDADGGYFGGGIYSVSPGTVTLVSSSITNNTAQFSSGGGIYAILAAGTMNLVNTTVSKNKADISAGGIGLQTGTLNLYNVTLTNNMADYDGSGTGDGGGLVQLGGPVNLKNTLLAGNIDKGGESPDCLGTITSATYNIVGDDSGCTYVENTGDQVGIILDEAFILADILSTSLNTYGGPTLAIGLTPGSPAIDLADPAGCTDEGGAPLVKDQRGYPRPVNVRCDVGAYEFGTCGDGAVDPGEGCDNAAANNDSTADACRTTCVNPTCGDGVKDSGEGCDDGNLTNGDGCQANCALPTCGDSVVDTGEECDDGNASEEDGCSVTCTVITASGSSDNTATSSSGSSGGGCFLSYTPDVLSLTGIIPIALVLIPFAIRRKRASSIRSLEW